MKLRQGPWVVLEVVGWKSDALVEVESRPYGHREGGVFIFEGEEGVLVCEGRVDLELSSCERIENGD